MSGNSTMEECAFDARQPSIHGAETFIEGTEISFKRKSEGENQTSQGKTGSDNCPLFTYSDLSSHALTIAGAN